MKKTLLVLMLAFASGATVTAQTSGVPSVKLKDLDGAVVNSNDVIANDGKPVILSFWATWCKPCVNELNAIKDIYDDMVEETGVKLVALSIDDARTIPTVAPFVNGKGWDYEVYLDPNGDFKRAMNVNLVPHTFLLNGKGEVVNQHTSYAPGDEEKLFDLVRKTANGEAAE